MSHQNRRQTNRWRMEKVQTNPNRFDRNGKYKGIKDHSNWSLAQWATRQQSDRCVYPHALRAHGTYYKLADIVVDVICVRNILIYGHFKVCVLYLFTIWTQKKGKQTNDTTNLYVGITFYEEKKQNTSVDSITFRIRWIQEQFNCLISDNRQNWKNQHFLIFWAAIAIEHASRTFNRNQMELNTATATATTMTATMTKKHQPQKESQLFDCTHYAVPKNQ